MPADAARPDLESPKKPSLVKGRKMLCPNCEKLRDPLNEREFKRLDRKQKYESELNIVFQCVKPTGGCGHVFSPTSPEFTQIIEAWLRGDLVMKNGNNADKNKEAEVVRA